MERSPYTVFQQTSCSLANSVSPMGQQVVKDEQLRNKALHCQLEDMIHRLEVITGIISCLWPENRKCLFNLHS